MSMQTILHASRVRWSALVALFTSLALMLALAPSADAQTTNGWPSYTSDSGNTNQATATGPETPGVKWLRDFAEPHDDDQVDAPEGYDPKWGSQGQGMPVVANDGTLVMRAENEAEGGERSTIGIDPETGAVLWEFEETSTSFRGCEAAVDSQGRVWVEHFGAEEHAYVALDATTGTERARVDAMQNDDELARCGKSQLVIGGAGDAERLLLLGEHEDPDDIVAIDVSQPDGQVVIDWEFRSVRNMNVFHEILGGPRAGTGNSYHMDIVALSDTHAYIPVRTYDDANEGQADAEIVELDLTTGVITNRVDLPEPTPGDDEDPVDHADYDRLHLLLADDTLVAGPRGASIHHLVGYDVSAGLPSSETWLTRLEDRPSTLSAQADNVVFTPGGNGNVHAYSLADGSHAFEAETGTSAQRSRVIVDAADRLFVNNRLSGSARARDISALGADGEAEWWFHEDAVAEQQEVGSVGDLNYGHGNLLLGPIDDDGTLYAASRSASNTAMLAIDDAGDLPTDFRRDPDRSSGDSRWETADELSREFDEADSVVIARGDNFPDALAGAPLAAHLEGPILLSPPSHVLDDTMDEIERLGASEAHLLGGEVALSSTVESQLQSAGLDVTRYAGENRYDTARLIAEAMPDRDHVFVAAGTDFPDAVAVSALGAATATPIVLATESVLPDPTAEVLEDTIDAHIVGGEAVISVTVGDEISSIVGGPVDRMAGPDRWATSADIADHALMMDVDPSTVWIATGADFPDSLAAAPVAGATAAEIGEDAKGVLLLVNGWDLDASGATRDWIADHAANIDRVRAVGGDAVITQDALDAARQLAGID